MSSSELVKRLRAADEALASMAPAADLEARIRARVVGRGAPRLSSMLAGVRRLHRPLILAFATAAALSAVSALRGHADAVPAPVAGGPEEPSVPIVNDRSRADGGPLNRAPGERNTGPQPVFHMPALAPRPDRGEHPAPPQRPVASPPAIPTSAIKPSARTPSKSSDEVEDRGRVAARVDAPRSAFASMRSPAGSAVVTPSSTWKPAFVARGNGDVAVHDASPSTAHGGDTRAPAIECKTPSALRETAAVKCKETGVALATFTFLEPCGGGQFGSIYFQCAEPEPEPDPELEPDPKPEPQQCIKATFEGGETCVDLGGYDKDPIAGVQKQATVACAQLGLTLSTLSVDAVGCPEQSGRVSYACCPIAPPSPQPDSCQDNKVGSDTCVDLSVLEAQASMICAQSGYVLASLSPLSGCPDGQASVAVISCCPTSL